ncbi:hypothetical protein [Anaerovibrio sp. JC8]|uniref:hypothetical protein n=1 Tax=Anaerovibrio sp. JC8 TaxID=1240085 RepID=UPI000A0F9E23|nr:hypothetical protein [Anaerovibrio sp. JC8]
MIALQGVYDNGNLSIKGYVPVKKANVLVIFPSEEFHESASPEDLVLFESLSGSISSNLDVKTELMEARDEKYTRAD